MVAVTLVGSLIAPAVGDAAPCLPSIARGAYQRCALDGGTIRLRSYFRRHAERVEDELLHLNAPFTLEALRDRDGWLRFGTVGGEGAAAIGAGIFSAAVVGSAHTPRVLRPLFDHPLHVGPAIFDGGGMGAGFGGKL